MAPPEQPQRFQATRWSLIRRARGTAPEARAALNELCGIYWYPLYAFVRRRGHETDAADLTQDFFTRLIEKHELVTVDPKHGRFSSWLLASMTHFLANEWDRVRALKRGGGTVPVPIDAAAADRSWQQETRLDLTPEKLYERKLTMVLLDRVFAVLQVEYADDPARFAALKGALTGEATRPYAELAAELQISEGGVKRAVHTLRQRHKELLRDEVSQLVDDPHEVRSEIERLLRSLE